MKISLLFVLGVLSPPTSARLSLEDVLKHAKPSLAEMRLESALAEKARELALTGGLLREGASLSVESGPRWTAGGPTRSDVSLGADLPLVLSQGTSSGAASTFERATPLLRRAARAEAALALERAYLDAWLAEHLVGLRGLDVATVEALAKTARARRDAGADPAFQTSLVEGDLLRARGELADARALQIDAWGRIAARSGLPAAVVPLGDPPVAATGSGTDLRRRFEGGLPRLAASARLALEVALVDRRAAVTSARLSVRASGRREGDEHVATLGFAMRLPRSGESAAIVRETRAARGAAARDEEAERAELETRFTAAMERLRAAPTDEEPPHLEAALAAVQLRLEEGRERASEALPVRRQLLEAQAAALRLKHARFVALAEIAALTRGVEP